MAVDKSGMSRITKWAADWDKKQTDAYGRALKEAGKAGRKAIRADLRKAGNIFVQEIRARTPVFGGTKESGRSRITHYGNTRQTVIGLGSKKHSSEHRPGMLRKATKMRVALDVVTVFNDAKAHSARYPKGYRYGKRLEFDPAYAARYAFFYPGRDAAWPKAKQAFDDVLTRVGEGFYKTT